ncbi:hypothetical protein [Pigmentiphaga litoralis]|uniref:Oligosaccharide repeat unit polymerase n=1 Tax=Pigmentiphaga litoralis TaxID=516702 RepID=A0A7Y9LME6_9BURK|nr:hypothetical protein [Pigmentiphaga litoralis]NYE24231.1 hypothetical protein [Pigmentiphaga litoralis]NYE82155.1 hypothetical protein [Pigmentiphaga litoralis]
MLFYSIILVIGLSIQIVGAYTIWFSRTNIVTHVSAGFIVIGYLIPGLFTNYYAGFSQESLDIYVWTSFVGAIAYLLGLQASRFYSVRKGWIKRKIAILQTRNFERNAAKQLKILLVLAIGLLVLGYVIMGFVPMFAADPLSAKQFKGEYRDSYLRAAWFFRSGLMIAIFVMPIAAVYSFVTKKRWFLFASVLLGLLIMVSLAKGAAANWLILAGGVLAARKLRWFLIYFVFVIGLNLAGSIFNYMLSVLTGLQLFSTSEGGQSFADMVAAGAPDMVDQLNLLEAFISHGSPWTYGRTFIGGLVPFSYEWNPSVWTLNQLNDGADVTEIVSGGLRLPISLWGYVSFGWIGVVMVPALSGFLLGCFMRIAKSLINGTNDTFVLAVVTVVLSYALIPISAFYALSLYFIPAVFISIFLVQRKRFVIMPGKYLSNLAATKR